MKRLTYILMGVLFLLYYICYQGVLSHIVFYHEEHHLFLFSNLYFHQCIQSEGWLGYLTNFIIQFFYIPSLGSAILALMLTLIYWFVNRIIKILSGKNDLLQLSLIPSLSFFFYTMSADHSLSVVTGGFLLLFLLYVIRLRSIQKRKFCLTDKHFHCMHHRRRLFRGRIFWSVKYLSTSSRLI
jgi:hypothetical protein